MTTVFEFGDESSGGSARQTDLDSQICTLPGSFVVGGFYGRRGYATEAREKGVSVGFFRFHCFYHFQRLLKITVQ